MTSLLESLRASFAIFVIAARRLWWGRGLALAGAFGLTAVIAFTLSVPLYADAVYHRILGTEVARGAAWRRPPFAFLFRYVSRGQTINEQGDWAQIAPADAYLTHQAPASLGLPRTLLVRYFTSDSFPIFPAPEGGDTTSVYETNRQALTWLSVGHLSDLAKHAGLVEGQMPLDRVSVNAPMDVLVSQRTANKLGLQVGERYAVFANKLGQHKAVEIVRIAGIWTPRDTSEKFWFDDPHVFDSVLLTTEANYKQHVAPTLRGNTSIAMWYMDFDGAAVRSDTVSLALDRIRETHARAETLLAGIRLETSPQQALEKYQQTSQLLTVQLLAFSAPLLLLLFAFVTLVSGLMANGRRNEVAVLRSRGATVGQVLGISFLEALALAAVAIVAGIFAGESIARLIGLTRSFLTFDSADALRSGELPVLLTPSTLRFGLIVAALATGVIILPVVGSARHTIITYKQERARALQAPWWQRAWLDVLLLIPAAYGTWLLRQQGTIALPGALSTSTSEDPFGNPLLFLAPAFAMLALTLFLIRLMPIALRVLAWILGKLPGIALVLATRQLARTPSFYSAPLLSLALTLSLATFTASLAATLDQHLIDRLRYTIGGDMTLIEAEVQTPSTSLPGQTTGGSPGDSPADSDAETAPARPRRGYIPMSDYAGIDGVVAATRVGFFKATARFGSGNVSGQFAGIDRMNFAQVAFWRRDFASQSLGSLMNALAAAPDGVLAPEPVLKSQGLRIGDTIRVNLTVPDGQGTISFRVVGAFDRWPGWVPDPKDDRTRSLFVGNLDYISEQVGMQLPYRIWLKTEPGASPAEIVRGVDALGVMVLRVDVVDSQISYEQTRPERQGLFGVLSVGFAAAALMTVLGFLLYAVFSLRRRFIELGVLRAVGLGARQMAAFLAWELALLLGTGIGAGTLLGVAASNIYIPFMQIGLSAEARAVPFRVILPWPAIYDIYALFGALFVIVLGLLVVFALRMKVFQAIKLGETE